MTDQLYDLAVSFAGEQRDYVSRTVDACKRLGLSLFYDRDKSNEWWGLDFVSEQRSVYSSRTRYFVPFISAEYLDKPYPMDEFSAAMMTAVKQGDGYILPVLMDDTRIPVDLLHPHIHYLRASDYSPDELAAELAARAGASHSTGRPPTELGAVVEHALAVRLPKVVPLAWSKYEEVDRVFDVLTTRFRQGADHLNARDFRCTVRRQDDRLAVRVERAGETVAGLNVFRGGMSGDDQIGWRTGWRDTASGTLNGWVTPIFDKDRGASGLTVSDLAASNDDTVVPYEAFFTLLWDKLIDQIER